MEITEKWLGDIGGWQAMKAAREYVRLGSVKGAARQGNTFTGLVGSGPRSLKATLVVNDRSRVDCKCGCPDASRRGLICAHGLAVALAVISPPPQAGTRPQSGGISPSSPGKENTSPAVKVLSPQMPMREVAPGTFTIYIAPERLLRKPPGAVPIFLRFQSGGDDRELAVTSWLKQHGMRQETTALQLAPDQLDSFLKVIAGHERVFLGTPNVNNAARLRITNSLCIDCTIKIDKHSQEAVYQLKTRAASSLNVLNGGWIFDQTAGVLSKVAGNTGPAVTEFVNELLTEGRVTRPLPWIVTFLAELTSVIVPVEGCNDLSTLRVVPAEPDFILHLDGGFRILTASLLVKISKQTHKPLDQGVSHIYPAQDESDKSIFYVRNRVREQQAIARLEAAGFKPTTPGNFELKGEDAILKFHASELPRLRSIFTVESGDLWAAASRNLTTIRPRLHSPSSGEGASSGQDWLSLEVAYESSDGFRIPRNEVLRLIRSGKRDMKGQNGKRYVLDMEEVEDLEETLQDVGSRFTEGGARLAVRPRQAGALSSFATNPAELKLEAVAPLDAAEVKKRLGPLGQMLRPYQLEGVTWMERLSRMRAGGLLADEMGLGKTVQTLALIRLILAGRKEGSADPVLVICPTSLLSNWSDEAARFVPDLKTHISHESERLKHLDKLHHFDVIFTSYALIVRDLINYKALHFSAVVLDEASFIRNADTATAKAVRELPASAMFALTGTPVENSVKDLWSIFEFILPGYLPEKEAFHERFAKPLAQSTEALKSRAVMERLRRLTQTYVLRRTKREVVKELPEKIEKVVWCELSAPQKEVYQRLLEEGREEIRQARKRTGQGAARMTMFTVLLRLRQTCNDLRLLKMDTTTEDPSGKWPVLEEAFTEIVEGGHKALIFSQFVGMLKLIREKAESLDIPYCYLDGSSKDRGEQVAAFQTQQDKKLFLISLKAGGYGLNLTAADHVMLVDPWWNPAVEAQAIDRAHRIGQGRTVTAYRLVTRGTVEEKILKLQEKKRAVMDMAFDDDAAVMAGVTDDELEEMLR